MSLTRIQRGMLNTGSVIVPDNLYTTGIATSSTFLAGDGSWIYVAIPDQVLFSTSSVKFANVTATNSIVTSALTASSSSVYLTGLTQSTATYQLYYNSSTGKVSYSIAVVGGGSNFNLSTVTNQALFTTSSVTFNTLNVSNINLNTASITLGQGIQNGVSGVSIGTSLINPANGTHVVNIGYNNTITTSMSDPFSTAIAIGNNILIDHASSGDFTGGAVVLNGNPYVNLWSDGGFYVKPVRLFPHYYYDQHQVLWYNTYSGEIAIGLFPIPYATTSTNLENGTTGQIPYQTTAGNTAFFGPGISGQILVSAGTGTPTYTNTTTIKVGFANAAGRLLADNTGSQYVGHAAQADSINPLNTGTQYVGNAAQADKLNPLNTSTQFVGLAAVANQVNSLNPATNLTVASLLVTTGTTIGQSLSVGGYPLDINGRALIDVLNTESSALIVSNYNPNLLPRIHVRGWGQNIPAGLTTTAQSGSLVIDGARGNPVSPTANQANDTLGQFNIGGFDGSNYLTTSTNGAIFSLFVSAAENFAYNGTTTTNAGTGLGIRLQPPRVWYTATSRPQVLQMTWTTSTSAPPGLTMNLGQGSDGTLAYLTDSANGNLYQGFGRTNFNFVNGVLTISNVTPTDGSPDNTSLTTNGSNIVSLSTNRRNAVSGRRNPVQANDILTQIDWFGQSVPNATSTGILTSQISSKALDNFTSTQAGSQLSISTANSGTTTLTSRLQLDDRNNYYSATNHTFQDTLGNTIFSANTTTGVTLINATETMYTWPSATGTITPSISSGTVHYMTLSGNITLNSIANAVTGSSITLIMNQPSSGGPYTLSSTMKWAAGSKTLSVSNSATDIATVFYDGTNYWATLNKGFF